MRFARFSIILVTFFAGCSNLQTSSDPCEGRAGCGPTVITGIEANFYQKEADGDWTILPETGEKSFFAVQYREESQYAIGFHTLHKGPADVIMTEDVIDFSASPLYEISWMGAGEELGGQFDFHDTLYSLSFTEETLAIIPTSVVIDYYAKPAPNPSGKLTLLITQ